MLFLLLFFSLNSYADDMSSEKYCFSSYSQAKAAEIKFKAIQVPNDTTTVDENCLVVQMRPHRRELVQRYILDNIPGSRVAFSSEEIKREPCLLKVEKEKIKAQKKMNAELNVMANAQENTQDGTEKETFQIQTLDEFELSVDQDQIRGKCKYITPNSYQISLEVKKTRKPIVPDPLPPGTIVGVNQPPTDQETMTLQTELRLNRGDRIEIGSIVKDLKNKSQEVSIEPDVKLNRTSGQWTQKVYLSFL